MHIKCRLVRVSYLLGIVLIIARANCSGSTYDIETKHLTPILELLNINFQENYVEKIVKKYYLVTLNE